jgi:RNaseH domain of pPIWI_RE/pPIWI_RE module N-terminal domain/MID domain of pPIWI_RE
MAASHSLRLTSLTIAPGTQWNVICQVTGFPGIWLEAMKRAYHSRPGIGDDWSLPTRSLIELLMGLDPAIIHVSYKLGDEFITALTGADTVVIAAAVAAWATADVTPGDDTIDWWELCQPEDLEFRDKQVNLLEYDMRPNGTAAPAASMFNLLPAFLAQQVVSAHMPLLERRRDWILGPPQADGRRSAVLWPPEVLESPKHGDSLVTAKVTFHVETVPGHPIPSIHADASISRFPLRPVTYVPSRGDGPPGATIWLHAPEGFLRPVEPHTLLASPARKAYSREAGKSRWQWSPGLARVLARLTHLPFPNPEKVFTSPATAADEGAIRAYILYSEGTKSLAGDIDDLDQILALDEAEQSGKARTLTHAANTGLMPRDHVEAHQQLTSLFAPLSLRAHDPLEGVTVKGRQRPRPAVPSDREYTLELWTQSSLTREAILAALEHHHHLVPHPDPADPSRTHFTGDITLDVVLGNAGPLGSGIDRPEGNRQPEATLVAQHAKRVTERLGRSDERRAAILELGDAAYFARSHKIDPKPALKKGFARTNRRLQCLQPAKEFTPPTKPPTGKRKPPEPYPGTRFGVGTILRASAAINDSLRQLGHLGLYETPASLPDLEQIGIWLHHDGATCIPLVIRLDIDGTATAHLASDKGTATLPIPYEDLPEALANGKGRIRSGPQQKAYVASFLRNALGTGDGGSRDTRDRVVFVRSASFRWWGWDWLQDKHIRADQLILPGTEIKDGEELPRTMSPHDCPGLRIIRVRERSSGDEVARGFGASYKPEEDGPTGKARVSGLFKFSDRIFYSVNPRSDQMQTPLGVTKLDPDTTQNFTKQATSPVPLEIFPAFLQPDDDITDFAALASSLRRMYLHTEQATTFPAPLHLCELADEYI